MACAVPEAPLAVAFEDLSVAVTTITVVEEDDDDDDDDEDKEPASDDQEVEEDSALAVVAAAAVVSTATLEATVVVTGASGSAERKLGVGVAVPEYRGHPGTPVLGGARPPPQSGAEQISRVSGS